MKKIFALLLTLAVMFSLVACGSADDKKLEEYLEKNRSQLISAMKASATGLNCDISVSAKDAGFVFDFVLKDLNNLSDEQKDLIQTTYDRQGSTWETALSTMRKELPELTSLTIYVREADGDLIATVNTKA